jgi:cytochrome c oxidase assembly protein subunit 15
MGAGLKAATRMAWIWIAGIAVQAVVGGITVWIKLIPWLVGVHFVLSAIMIVLSSLLVWRVYQPKRSAVAPLAFVLAAPQAALGAVVVFIGVLTTGSGPHAGDANSVRNGLSFDVLEKYHSVPAYLLLVVEIAVFVALLGARGSTVNNRLATRVSGGLIAITIAQATLGIVQTYLVSPAVPALLVGFHMFGAAVMVSALAFGWLSLRGSKASGF